jgi:hypothetical protein
MLIWDEKRQLRKSILKEEKDNLEFDFHPSIKTGPKTRPRFAVKNFFNWETGQYWSIEGL